VLLLPIAAAKKVVVVATVLARLQSRLQCAWRAVPTKIALDEEHPSARKQTN
jgi:hypothetical protein